MKKWKSHLFPVIALAMCLGLAACSGGVGSEDGSDNQEEDGDTEYSAPESFEGMVKNSEITAVYDMYWGTWIGEDNSELIVGLNGSGEDRFEWYDVDEELTASGYIQLVPEYNADYFYNEHDGWAHHAWRDEDGALHIDSFGVFTKKPLGRDVSESDCKALAGVWSLNGVVDADSIIEVGADGRWSLSERTEGNGNLVEADSGKLQINEHGDNQYFAVSDQSADVFYPIHVAEPGTMYWGYTNDYYILDDDGRGDLIPDEHIPVLMGGALPFTNMQNLRTENNEDGTYRYEDFTEDGQILIVNAAEPTCFVPEVQDLADYLTACAMSLSDSDTYELLSAEENEEYSEHLSYPVYIVTYTAGENEDTQKWTVFAMDTDSVTYLYGVCEAVDTEKDMDEIYQNIFSQLYLSDGN